MGTDKQCLIISNHDFSHITLLIFIEVSTKATSEEISSSGSSEVEDSSVEIDHMHNASLPMEMIPMGSSEETFASGSDESTMHPDSSVGCLYNGTSYELGEEFFVGCDERCECTKNGEVKCMERCSIPLFKKGSFAHDKMCFEEPSGIDDCCVIIACARGTKSAGEPRGKYRENNTMLV